MEQDLHHGQEINIFFYSYGLKGIYGIFLMSMLISVIIYKTLIISKKYNINNYDDFLNKIIKNKIIKKSIKLIINIFLLFSFYIMVAGINAFLNQQFNLDKLFCSIIFCTFCFFIFNKNIEKIIKINSILVPIIILIFLIFGLKNINYLNNQKIIEIKNNWTISAIIYTSYNTITLIGLTGMMNKYLKNKKDCLTTSIITGVSIFILAFTVFILLVNLKEKVEMPILYISNIFGGIYKYLYCIMIFFSIFTTAISDGITFLKNVSENNQNISRTINFLICITAIPFSLLGFSNLVNIVYPVFGVIGLLQIFFVLIKK